MQDLSVKKNRDKDRRDERARRRRQYLAVQLGLQEEDVGENNSKRVVKMLTRSAEVQDNLDHELALIRARKVGGTPDRGREIDCTRHHTLTIQQLSRPPTSPAQFNLLAYTIINNMSALTLQ